MTKKCETEKPAGLKKCPTGIAGFDDITGGGLPQGRPTLVCGGAGSGKTLFAMQFLINGAVEFDEPGVFISFEENETELACNVASLGWDLRGLCEEKKLALDHIHIEKSEIEETGEFDLDGLFIRIEMALRAVGATRIAIDSIEALFGGFSNESQLRAEIRRLFRRLKTLGLTAVITGEKGERSLTRQGLEEYISDCVVFLDVKMIERVATRRLRVVKYRGTAHGTNEYPFLITEKGFSVFPITALEMDYAASTDRISSGMDRLDAMLGGEGYFKGSSVLVSGTAGTGKSSLAACFVSAACLRGERAIYFSFEEAASQIVRNMGSIGIDLESAVDSGLLTFRSVRATTYGLETHLAIMLDMIDKIGPSAVVIDPISNMSGVADIREVKEMLTRIIDCMKTKGVTAMFTDLSHAGGSLESTETAISSLMDTWILLRDIEISGERNRGMYVLKSRGMNHSNQIREFVITGEGLHLNDVYTGPGGVLTGTARVAREAAEKAEALHRTRKIERMKRDLLRKEKALRIRIEEMKENFDAEKQELEHAIAEAENREKALSDDEKKYARMRGRD